jgi:hypothetical protein
MKAPLALTMSRLYVSLHHRSTHRRALCHSVTKALVSTVLIAGSELSCESEGEGGQDPSHLIRRQCVLVLMRSSLLADQREGQNVGAVIRTCKREK